MSFRPADSSLPNPDNYLFFHWVSIQSFSLWKSTLFIYLFHVHLPTGTAIETLPGMYIDSSQVSWLSSELIGEESAISFCVPTLRRSQIMENAVSIFLICHTLNHSTSTEIESLSFITHYLSNL